MLVLSRRDGESIVIPECGIVIRVLESRSGRVRIGISAPPDLAVHREEIWDRIRRELADGEPAVANRDVAVET
jgi:carbon storage regulator